MTAGRRQAGTQAVAPTTGRRGMTLSELIGRLQAIRVEFHGDPPVDCAVQCEGETVDGQVTRLVPVLVRGTSHRIGGKIVHGRLLILSAETGDRAREATAGVQGEIGDLIDRVDPTDRGDDGGGG